MFRDTAWKYTHIRGCDVFETSHARSLTWNAILLLQLIEGYVSLRGEERGKKEKHTSYV
jgi:hypothetical protein